eukprot:scaffold414559_cov22-Prasinocladus_malaysianus.AAC.1
MELLMCKILCPPHGVLLWPLSSFIDAARAPMIGTDYSHQPDSCSHAVGSSNTLDRYGKSRSGCKLLQ